MTDLDHIKTACNTDIGSSIDLGLDDDLAAIIRETDGVKAKNPILSEQIELMMLTGEIYVSLIEGRELDPGDLKHHLRVIESIQRSQIIKLVELIAADNQTAGA